MKDNEYDEEEAGYLNDSKDERKLQDRAEADLDRFAAIVREFHRQGGSARCRTHIDACDALQDEIGEARMQAARDEYDERFFRAAEAQEDAWIESHYR